MHVLQHSSLPPWASQVHSFTTHLLGADTLVLISEPSLGHLRQDREGWLLKLTLQSLIPCFMEKSLTGAEEALTCNTEQIASTTERDPC